MDWKLAEARNKLSELINKALHEGPQHARCKEFDALRKRSEEARLPPEDYIQFLNETQPFMRESVTPRPPIQGSVFLL